MFGILKKKIVQFSEKLVKKIGQDNKDSVKIEEEQIKEPLPAEDVAELEEKLEELKTDEKAVETKKEPEKKEEKEIKIGFLTKVKGLLTKTIEIKENEIEEFLSDFELELMEADVDQEIAEELTKKIKAKVVGKEIEKGADLTEFIKARLKEVLTEETKTNEINLDKMIQEKTEKPFVIMFLGPNGAGKTTTIAKLTKRELGKGKKVVLAAADTFRAAAIEQLEKHAEKLNVRIVKHKYGSDPAAVGFDAIQAAKSNNLDIVMIDTAGRQETNINLMNELKKIERVNKPDLKIFVGEALSGKALIEQAENYNKEIGIDAFVLTKIDADVKGGTAISLLAKLKKPIVFVGTGQKYSDLVEFTQNFIIDRVV